MSHDDAGMTGNRVSGLPPEARFGLGDDTSCPDPRKGRDPQDTTLLRPSAHTSALRRRQGFPSSGFAGLDPDSTLARVRVQAEGAGTTPKIELLFEERLLTKGAPSGMTWGLAPPSPIVPILGECWTGDRPSLEAPFRGSIETPNDGCGITHHGDNRPPTYFTYYTY